MKDKEQQRLANQTAICARRAGGGSEPAARARGAQARSASGRTTGRIRRVPAVGPQQCSACTTAAPQAAAPVPATQVEGWDDQGGDGS